VGVTLAAAVLLLALAPAQRAEASSPPMSPVQAFTTASIDWSVCYSPSTPIPGALGCSGSNDTLTPNTSYTTYDVIAIASGDRLAMPTIFTPAPWLISSPPVTNATLQLDAFCDGGVDTIAGGPDAGDGRGASGFEGAAQPWPDAAVWQPYNFTHEPANNYVGSIKPTPAGFGHVSYDRATLQTIWLGNAIPLFVPSTQQQAALALDVATETSTYTAGLRVQSFMLDGEPKPPPNNFVCVDTPFRMVVRSDSLISPSLPGLYPRWAIFTSQPDLINGQVTRLLDMQCMDVGSVLGSHGGTLSDADGDCLPSTTDANDALADQDGDLLPDGLEVANGTPVTNADLDGDGAKDDEELFQFTSPLVADTDGDASLDKQDDLAGFNCDWNGGGHPNACVANFGDTPADDNCPVNYNLGQENTDSQVDFTNSPNSPDGAIFRGDATNPHQDHQGDACDNDADNDGLSNLVEAGFQHTTVSPGAGGGPPAGTLYCLSLTAAAPAGGSTTQVTDPLNPDTDSDGGLDGRECLFGSDPLSAALGSCQPTCTTADRFPALSGDTDVDKLAPDAAEVFYRTSSISQPVPSLGELMDIEQPPDGLIGPSDGDADGDYLSDGVEVKWYATSPANFDTDGDGCSDGREAADVNGDHKVNSTDTLAVDKHGLNANDRPGGPLVSGSTIMLDAGTELNDTNKNLTGYTGKQVKSINGWAADITAPTTSTITMTPVTTTLSAAITATVPTSGGTFTVASTASWPGPTGQVTIGAEQIKYSAAVGGVVTVAALGRGANGTTAAAHAAAAVVTVAPVNATSTSIVLASTAGFPASGVVVINTEAIGYGLITGGNTLTTLTRGQFFSTPAAAINGATVTLSTLNHTAWAGGSGGLPTTGSAYTVQSHFPLGLPNLAYFTAGVRRNEVATYDINKDGKIDSTDVGIEGNLAGTCAAGPGAQTAYDIEPLSK
jgi:hypothetical protein